MKGLLLRLKYNKAQLLALQNYIECEAHREVLLEALKQYENTEVGKNDNHQISDMILFL